MPATVQRLPLLPENTVAPWIVCGGPPRHASPTTLYAPPAPLLRPPPSSLLRHFSAAGNLAFAKDSKEPWWKESVERLRNIWISGLIDPNKMELTERVLFYGGRMHELRRRDEVPQIIDWMGLGKTIHSAATYCTWKDYQVGNISKLSFKFNWVELKWSDLVLTFYGILRFFNCVK